MNLILGVGRKIYGISKRHECDWCGICKEAGRPAHGWGTGYNHQLVFGRTHRWDVGKFHKSQWYGKTDAERCEVTLGGA